MRGLVPAGFALALFSLPLSLVLAGPGEDPHRGSLFEPSAKCLACHNGLTVEHSEEVSIGADWRGSMMANSSRDPYWQASVRRETLEHPTRREAIEDECATCHMPMARAQSQAGGRRGGVFEHLPIGRRSTDSAALAADGVGCTLCHQIQPEKLGSPDSFNGGFVIDTTRRSGDRPVFGPFEVDRGRTTIMHSATGFRPSAATHIRQSELCATCHTLYTTALGPNGDSVGRLPEQVPYLEWQHSTYRDERSCQSCHMPAVANAPISSVLGEPRVGWARHTFRGANAFMLGMLNRYREELGVEATPTELDASARGTLAHLQGDTARVSIQRASILQGNLVVDVDLRNLAGHKLPTGYPSRRVWVHLAVRDVAGQLVFESGALQRDGGIAGNDNDADPARFEPHYQEVGGRDEVQIYESILVDASGQVTTGLLKGVDYAKDNRLLPRGFDKARAAPDIAVRGGALEDLDFVGGADRIRYRVPLGTTTGPFKVVAELYYQPIAMRWARNLREHRATEIDRFVSYYDAMADSSAVRLAEDTITVSSP